MDVPMPPLPFDPIREAGHQWERHWGAETAPRMMAVISIVRAQQIVFARLNAALEPFALTYSQYEALLLLFVSSRGALPLGKMGVRLQVHLTNVTKLVDALERLGYVERVRHPDDRRTTLAVITDHGREIAEQSTRVLNGIAFGTSPLADAELEHLVAALRELRRDAGDFTEEP